MLNIPVVLGTIRRERRSLVVARYVVDQVTAAGHQTELVDFLALPLPLMDLPVEPSSLGGRYPDPNVQAWSEIAAAADGFVFVTPEYNHGYPAVLKNAFDWLYREFSYKACGFVGVSDGPVGGARAVEQLRLLAGSYGMYDVRETVLFAKVQNCFDDSGRLVEPRYAKLVSGLIGSLGPVAQALRALRAGGA